MSHQAENVSAGTQVVSLVEVRGTNNSLVHPRGAVGVVTRTPTGDQKHFLVRFPDGFEASLAREQLDVLKHFKDRLRSGDAAMTDFDLEKLIVYRCVVGSRAYWLVHLAPQRRARSAMLDVYWPIANGCRHFGHMRGQFAN
jgi:hypothetical protein